MIKQEETLFHKKKPKLDRYTTELRKTSNDLRTHMKPTLYRDKLNASLLSGLFLSVILGGINFGVRALQIRSFDKQNLIKTELQRKLLEKKRAFSTIIIVDILILFSLSRTLESCRDLESKDFSINASKLAKDYFKKIFVQEDCTKEMAVRARQAAKLIINNMPKEKLEYMRALAIDRLSYDKEGCFIIDPTAIEIAQAIVSEHLDQHPEIKNAVNQIMQENTPQTYVLNVAKQKTK